MTNRSGGTGRTRPTNPVPNQGGGGFNLNIGGDLPDNLSQLGDTPFFNTQPEIEPNDCGQIHPSLAYLCDLDLENPTGYAEPEYEVSVNGCGVCVTVTQNFSPTETASQTYCYVLPACRPPSPPPSPPPTSPGNWLMNWPPLPDLPELPPGNPLQRYTITFTISGTQTAIGLCGGDDFEYYFGQCIGYNQTFPLQETTVSLTTQGLGKLESETISYPATEVQFTLDNYAVTTKTIITSVFYKGTEIVNGVPTYRRRYLYQSYGWTNAAYAPDSTGEDMYYSYSAGGTIFTATVAVSPQPPASSLPSPQPPIDMNCCADVRRLIRMVARVERRVGVFDFPVPVPELLLSDRGNKIIKIQNIPELILWLTRQIDALVGELPGKLEIEDIDPQTEGNQSKRMDFPTLSDLMLEVAGISINNKINVETILTTVLSILTEVGSAKTTAITNYHAIQAILDYLSPDLDQDTVKVPLSFSPGQTKLDKLLKPTTTEVKIVKLGSQTDLKDDLADLKKFASEWRAQNVRRIKIDGTEAVQVMNFIRDAKNALNPDTGGTGRTSDFSSFIEQAETGFITSDGITDTANPYGRPYQQRPKIREIGNTSDQGTEAR